MVLDMTKMNKVRPFAIGLVATLIAIAAAMTMGGGWASAQTGTAGTAPDEATAVPDETRPEREGQIKRRGLFGKAVRVGGDSFLVETRQGEVLVLTNDETVVRKPPEGIVRFEALEVGDRVAVWLKKPTDEEAAEAPASDVYRTGTALKILIIPDQATRQHTRAVVLEKVRDRMRIIDRDGTEREIDIDIEIDGEAGDELVLITQDSNANVRARVRASVRAEVIENRLERIAEAREEVRERVEETKVRVEQARAEARVRIEARLDSVEVDADVRARIEAKTEEVRERVRTRTEQARDRADEASDRIEAAREEAKERAEEARERAEKARENARATAESRKDAVIEVTAEAKVESSISVDAVAP